MIFLINHEAGRCVHGGYKYLAMFVQKQYQMKRLHPICRQMKVILRSWTHTEVPFVIHKNKFMQNNAVSYNSNHLYMKDIDRMATQMVDKFQGQAFQSMHNNS